MYGFLRLNVERLKHEAPKKVKQRLNSFNNRDEYYHYLLLLLLLYYMCFHISMLPLASYIVSNNSSSREGKTISNGKY